MKTALFPGTFDPITRGHEALIRRGLSLFDRIIVTLGDNTQKHTLFSLEQRMEWVRATFADEPRIEVDSYHELTIDYCKQHNIQFILRGLRNDTDFRYEEENAKVNHYLAPEIETVMVLSHPEETIVSSSVVRELMTFGKDVSALLPQAISNQVATAYKANH